MIGTDKQIEWANQIVQTWIDYIEQIAETMVIRSSNGSMPEWFGEWYGVRAAKAIEQLKKTDARKASEIIDNRNTHMGKHFEQKMLDVSQKELDLRKAS
jgi:hypothetical protein